MTDIKIPQEEFEAKKLLAQLGQDISRGQAELMQLHQKKEDFFEKQEQELLQRLQLLLELSRDTLKEVDANQDELEAYAHQLNDFAKKLEEWSDKLDIQDHTLELKSQAFYADLDARTKEFANKKQDLTNQLSAVERMRKEQDKRTLALNARETAINDKYMQLMKTTQRLKK